jgi:hypothetical protein
MKTAIKLELYKHGALSAIQNTGVMPIHYGARALAHIQVPSPFVDEYLEEIKEVMVVTEGEPLKYSLGRWFTPMPDWIDLLIYKHDWVIDLFTHTYENAYEIQTAEGFRRAQQILGLLFGYSIDLITKKGEINSPPCDPYAGLFEKALLEVGLE